MFSFSNLLSFCTLLIFYSVLLFLVREPLHPSFYRLGPLGYGKCCHCSMCDSLQPHGLQGFPKGSAGKETACNAGEPGSIPGLERSPVGGIGYPLQCSWASLVAQLVKNLPAMQETWVWSLGWEDPLQDGMATHSSILAYRTPMDRRAWWATAHGVEKSWTQLSD